VRIPCGNHGCRADGIRAAAGGSSISCSLIAAFGAGFAVAGTLVGYGLGTFLPGYYRGVFLGGRQPDFNPVDVGIGLGCSEGLMLGVVVGLVVVVVLAWCRSRRASPNKPSLGAPGAKQKGHPS
jgi:hypothetical protein